MNTGGSLRRIDIRKRLFYCHKRSQLHQVTNFIRCWERSKSILANLRRLSIVILQR